MSDILFGNLVNNALKILKSKRIKIGIKCLLILLIFTEDIIHFLEIFIISRNIHFFQEIFIFSRNNQKKGSPIIII